MIRESVYFTFAGIPSSDFGIMNVSISSGLYEESFLANRSIKEFTIRGNDKPYFQEVKKDPKSIQVSFAFEDKWDDELINKVARWLDVDFYQPLVFSEEQERVYYVMPVDSATLIHNGLKQGYITLTLRCDSPYSYSRDIVTPWYNCVDTVNGVFITPYQFVEDGTLSGTHINSYNKGDKKIQPTIWIQKVGNGDLSIFNTSNRNEEFKFTNILDGEELFIDGENEIIETNLPNIWRYDYFNDNYLNLYYGKNVLQIKGNCKIKFQYRYKFII
jgi:predicted phage tail component-like protein